MCLSVSISGSRPFVMVATTSPECGRDTLREIIRGSNENIMERVPSPGLSPSRALLITNLLSSVVSFLPFVHNFVTTSFNYKSSFAG